MAAPYRRIDCHNHPDWLGHDFAAQLADMDAAGIEKTWLLSWETPVDEYEPVNLRYVPGDPPPFGPIDWRRCVSYAERAPERFVLGYAPDPRRPGACDRLRHAVATHGVKVYGELKLRMTYDDPDALRMFRLCGELGLPVIVHLDDAYPQDPPYPRPDWWYGGGIDAFARALAACPDTDFLGHAPGFWAHIAGDGQWEAKPYPEGPVASPGRIQELLAAHPNLHCDLSGWSGQNALARDPAHAARFLTEWTGRVLFGRDAFGSGLADLIDSLGLPEPVRRAVLRENAERLLARGPRPAKKEG